MLAGGRSSRMGTDKAQLRLGGVSLLDHAMAAAQAAGFAVSVSVAADSSQLALPAERAIPVVPDTDPELGPLGGMVSALEALAGSTPRPVLFLPVDVPLLPAEFLSWLWRRALSTDASAVVPRVAGREQPLCAVYMSTLADPLRRQIAGGERKVTRALRHAAPEHNLDCFDVEAVAPFMGWFRPQRWFTNVNTPEEWHALHEDTLRGDPTRTGI